MTADCADGADKDIEPDDRSERQRAARLVASIGVLRIQTRDGGRSEPSECATIDLRSGDEAGAFIRRLGLVWSQARLRLNCRAAGLMTSRPVIAKIEIGNRSVSDFLLVSIVRALGAKVASLLAWVRR